MRRSNKGMTLTELIIYSFLAILAGALLWGFRSITMRTQHATTASYLVSNQTETAISWLRRDLNETALASIQVYPNASEPNEAPGLSCVSNRDFETAKQLTTRWGAPQWDKHVLYTLESEPGSKLGNLVRWEREIANKNNLPVLCNVLPSSSTRSRSKVLIRRLVKANQTIENAGPGGQVDSDESGGFSVKFIRRQNGSGGEESLTNVNPRQGDPRHNTRMMEVELKLLKNEKRTHPDYFRLKFRVAAKQ